MSDFMREGDGHDHMPTTVPPKRYRTIVVDPPWRVGRGPEWSSNGPSRPLAYQTLHVQDIAALPIGDWAERDAHLYVWTINAYLEVTYGLVRHWGFRPSTLLTWCKKSNGIGLGGAFSLTTEFVLFARRGTCKSLRRNDMTWWEWPRGRHSEKPAAFYDMVESMSPGPYLDVFARRHRFNWDVYGNEVYSDIPLVGEP